jgi:hypothetical protein
VDVVDERLVMLWARIRNLRWHQWARVVAIAVLMDQMLGPLSNLPSDTTIVVVALGALFAPIPTKGE